MVVRTAQRHHSDTGSEVVIVLLDTEGKIVAANSAWRTTMAQRAPEVSIGDVGDDYVEALSSLYPGIEPGWLREQLSALATRRCDEVVATTPPSDDGAQGGLRITRLDDDVRPLLVATHVDLSDVAEAQDALHTVQDQLVTARSAERRRVAGSLAEVTSAHLEALRRDLASLRDVVDDDAALGLLARMEQSLGEATRETRNFAYLLHPTALDNGLVAASERLARDFVADAGIHLRYRTTGPVDQAPRAVQEAAFRVIQEALSNVHRHAGASRVSVTLSVRDDALRLRIADDGRGLPRGPVTPGVGISGMQDRAAELGGAVEVIGGRKGAIVLARLPFDPAPGR
jgi:signal transduction histidine kinase